MTTVHLDLLDTGFCTARSSLIATGTGWNQVRCHAPAFLIRHPEHGAVLFDTGYAPRLVDAFAQWPDRLYKYATPTTFGTPVVEGVQRFGLRASDVRLVIVSHLHADHVAGLRDFPQGRFIITRDALALQQVSRGVDAVRRGIVQQLFPRDFGQRCDVIDGFAHTALPHLGATHDLFGDGTIRLLQLPGHARGQLGAMLRTPAGEVLLCADGAWTTRAFRELRAPHAVTALMQDDMATVRTTLRAIHDFALSHPGVTILPTHCPETLRWGGAA